MTRHVFRIFSLAAVWRQKWTIRQGQRLEALSTTWVVVEVGMERIKPSSF